MKLLLATGCILFVSAGLAQPRQPKKAIDPVSVIDQMPVLADSGTALNMPVRSGQGTAVAMPTWAGPPPVRHEETISRQPKDVDRLKLMEGAQPDSGRYAPFFQFPRKDRRR